MRPISWVRCARVTEAQFSAWSWRKGGRLRTLAGVITPNLQHEARAGGRLAHVAHVREDEGEVLEEHGLARVRVRARARVRVRVRVRVRASATARAREG